MYLPIKMSIEFDTVERVEAKSLPYELSQNLGIIE
jgi:hypothetical protein